MTDLSVLLRQHTTYDSKAQLNGFILQILQHPTCGRRLPTTPSSDKVQCHVSIMERLLGYFRKQEVGQSNFRHYLSNGHLVGRLAFRRDSSGIGSEADIADASALLPILAEAVEKVGPRADLDRISDICRFSDFLSH